MWVASRSGSRSLPAQMLPWGWLSENADSTRNARLLCLYLPRKRINHILWQSLFIIGSDCHSTATWRLCHRRRERPRRLRILWTSILLFQNPQHWILEAWNPVNSLWDVYLATNLLKPDLFAAEHRSARLKVFYQLWKAELILLLGKLWRKGHLHERDWLCDEKHFSWGKISTRWLLR